MDPVYSTPFSKALLTSVFAGIATTVMCMIYDIAFRDSTHFAPSDFINVSSLIFFINLVFLIIGIIFYGLLQVKNGELIYIVLFILLTVLFVAMASSVHRSDEPLLNTEFHHLLVPIVIIMGVAASFGIPFLFHNTKFEKYVL